LICNISKVQGENTALEEKNIFALERGRVAPGKFIIHEME